MVDEHLELRDATRARKSQRGEELAGGKRLERGDGRAVGCHGLAARADDFADSSTDRVLDRSPVGRALIAEERDITVTRRGETSLVKGQAYLLLQVLPNFYFHVTTAYAILRHNGVDVGKNDFIGGIPTRD